MPDALRPGADVMVRSEVIREIRRNRAPDDGVMGAYEEAVADRLDYLAHVLEDVDMFVSPSAFLRERFIESGLIDGDRIVVSDNGYDMNRLPSRAPTRPPATDKLRVGYVGTIAEHKGIHLLIEALNGIEDERVSCHIWGDLGAFWEYTVGLRTLVRNPRVFLMGSFENDRITDVMNNLDLLVVPSLWFENSPLTIHEAAACGIPVIASDEGGLAEYVTPEVTGRLFQLGNAEDLRAKILSFLDTPMTAFEPGSLTLKPIEEDARDTERRYYSLLARTGNLVD